MASPTNQDRRPPDPRPSFAREFGEFLLHNKRWWITPILVVLAILVAMILLSSRAEAPFIYPR